MKFNISHDLRSLCSPETELLPQEKFILVVWPKEYFVLLLPRTVTKSLGCRSQSRLLPRSDRHWGSSVNICLAPEQMNRWAHKGTTLPLMDYAKISSAASSSADWADLEESPSPHCHAAEHRDVSQWFSFLPCRALSVLCRWVTRRQLQSIL